MLILPTFFNLLKTTTWNIIFIALIDFFLILYINFIHIKILSLQLALINLAAYIHKNFHLATLLDYNSHIQYS